MIFAKNFIQILKGHKMTATQSQIIEALVYFKGQQRAWKTDNRAPLYDTAVAVLQSALDTQKPAVFYCANGQSLECLEQGALAVLSNLMMKTNATSAEFMIGNEKDGKFYFTCSRKPLTADNSKRGIAK